MFIRFIIGNLNATTTAVKKSPIAVTMVKRVPTMPFICSRFPAPSACEIITCPAVAIPRHTIVAKLSIRLLCETAERPGVPT